MESIFIYIIQAIIFFGILNVWLIRVNKKTNYRGGTAKNLQEEFNVYGYPQWFFYLVGVLKILFALCIGVGHWIQILLPIGALGMSILMLGAIFSHFKVHDTLIKFIPASVMLFLSLFLLSSSI